MKLIDYLVKHNSEDLLNNNGDTSVDIEGTPLKLNQEDLERFCELLTEWENWERWPYSYLEQRYHVKKDARHHADQHLVFQPHNRLKSIVKDSGLMNEVSQSLKEYLLELKE